MPQFDVHRNSGRHKARIPYVLVVQSAQFDGYQRRVVVPLVRATSIGRISYAAFNPTFKIRGTSVVLHPLEMVSIPIDQLGEVVGSLVSSGDAVIAAMDELLARA
jgi:toxin CcdB